MEEEGESVVSKLETCNRHTQGTYYLFAFMWGRERDKEEEA